jgi:hypothetical protein
MKLLLGILAVWRVTHLLNAEDGPWDLFVRLRSLMGNSSWGTLLDCFYCLSLWIAAPFANWLGGDWKERLLLWPALSSGAILAEVITSKLRRNEVAPAQYFEEPEDSNVLRQKSTTRSEYD